MTADANGAATRRPLRPPHSHVLARPGRPAGTLLRRHWRRFGTFGMIGFTVFLAGLALQVALVRLAGMGTVTSYVIKTLASVQLSLLLNRYLTWSDRDIPMIRAAALFNVQQLTIQGIGVAAYAGLVRLGVGYIMANAAISHTQPAGYAASHLGRRPAGGPPCCARWYSGGQRWCSPGQRSRPPRQRRCAMAWLAARQSAGRTRRHWPLPVMRTRSSRSRPGAAKPLGAA